MNHPPPLPLPHPLHLLPCRRAQMGSFWGIDLKGRLLILRRLSIRLWMLCWSRISRLRARFQRFWRPVLITEEELGLLFVLGFVFSDGFLNNLQAQTQDLKLISASIWAVSFSFLVLFGIGGMLFRFFC